MGGRCAFGSWGGGGDGDRYRERIIYISYVGGVAVVILGRYNGPFRLAEREGLLVVTLRHQLSVHVFLWWGCVVCSCSNN